MLTRAVLMPSLFQRPEGARFSMAAGDFLELYDKPDAWDCMLSAFFLDTASV